MKRYLRKLYGNVPTKQLELICKRMDGSAEPAKLVRLT